jgi:acetyl esterase/lipase
MGIGRLTAVAGLAVAGVGATRWWRQLGDVAPELRSNRVLLALTLRGPRSLALARRLIIATASHEVADGVDVRVETVPGNGGAPDRRVLVHERTDRDRPSGALVWIHGGGLVMGVPEISTALCSRLASELDIVVVAPEYRLAPEWPFPAGLEDCVRGLRWVADRAGELGIDPARIAVGGGSAGGGLAACVAQVALDRGGPPVCFQLLQYPMLDDRTTRRDELDAIVWTQGSNRFAWAAYLGHAAEVDDLRAYASAARRTDLSGLPPAWIGVGDTDLFHDESVEYARRLRAAGVPCELVVVPGMYHAAEGFAPAAPAMREHVERLVSALGAALGVGRAGASTGGDG